MPKKGWDSWVSLVPNGLNEIKPNHYLEIGKIIWHNRDQIASIAAGNVQVHWPEGNVLIERGVADPECGIPDYNATVEVVRAD
ncbi:MAG TPA: hypothetical protein VNO70_16735 [Blastocatellia bacterium]|nr:hypothetical protein [Blastocatellia bacterium]